MARQTADAANAPVAKVVARAAAVAVVSWVADGTVDEATVAVELAEQTGAA